MNERSVIVKPSKDELSSAIAEAFVDTVKSAVDARGIAHVALTGGSMGTAFLTALGQADRGQLVWSAIHLWWGDERFLPAGDPERNDHQADEALLSTLSIPADNVHRVMTLDGETTVEQAANAYAEELRAHSDGRPDGLPAFDIVMLGMGPDTHVASLFPGHDETKVADRTTVPVFDSPKPPPQRVSLTFPALNSAQSVWLMVAGTDKADGVKLASEKTDATAHPASAVHGVGETIWWLDVDAASKLNHESRA